MLPTSIAVAALGAATLIPLTAVGPAAGTTTGNPAPTTRAAASTVTAPALTLPKGRLTIAKKPVIKVTRTSVPKSSCSAPFVFTMRWPTGVDIEYSTIHIESPPRQSGASVTYSIEHVTQGQARIVMRPDSSAGWCSDSMVPRTAKPGDTFRMQVQIAWSGWTGECLGGPCTRGTDLLLGLKKAYVAYKVVR